MPRLSGCRSGRPPGSLPSAPSGAQSDPLPTDSPGAAPALRRREPASADRHRGRRGRSPSRASRALRALTVLLVAVAALLALPLQAQAQTTFVSNLGQTTHASFVANLSTTDVSQQFYVGSTEVTLSTVKVKFNTVPGSMATVTAVIATGRDSSDSILATLTNPAIWSTTSTFTAPEGTTLAAGPNYHLIIEGTDGLLATTASDDEDSGGATAWLIGNTRQQRTTVAASGLGGTWTGAANALQISLEGPVVNPEPPKRVTGFDLHSSNSAPRGMWGNDDTFWVVNDASPNGAGDKLFAYNRSDGSRDSANDFDTLDGAGNNRPYGICSNGTTMFVGDRTDNKLYAYKMSDTTADSTKDITLDSDNGEPRGMWCDATTVYVANDGATAANKVFAYTISGGAYDSTKDFEQLYVSTDTAAENAETPRGIWSNGTTMFVADSDDDNVFAYKHSDESQDSGKNLALSSDNDNPNGMWFDGRILWVVDATDDMIYPYDLPGAQPDNTPADGAPAIRTPTSEDVWTATLTTQQSTFGVGFVAGVGSLSPGTTFDLDGVTYTVKGLYTSGGTLSFSVDKEPPREFTLSVAGESFSSVGHSVPSVGVFGYEWPNASLSWSANDTISVDLSVDSAPKDGVEVTADVSGITDSTDGVASANFQYQWIRVDGTDETDIDSETGSTYTPTGRRRGQSPPGAGGLRRRRGLPGTPPHQPPVRPGRRRRPAHGQSEDRHHRHHHIYYFQRASRPGIHPGRVGVRGAGGGYCQHGGLGRDRRA